MRVVGLMSGTSADGIDAVLAEIGEGEGDRLTATILETGFQPFDAALQARLATPSTFDAGEIARLHHTLGEAFAEAALGVMGGRGGAELIGCHGQTVAHLPAAGATLQLGSGAVIAIRTGTPTVTDFRSADLALGGQGAPLVPFADWHLFTHSRERRACLNVGGIANVTILGAGCAPDAVVAFDTGPGNMLMDACAGALTGGQRNRDEDGRLAAAGRVSSMSLDALLEDPYFARSAPKSCGREEFGAAFLGAAMRTMESAGLGAEDMLATLTALTAESVARALVPFGPFDRVLASGGGVHNPVLIGELRARGVAAEPLEAVGFSSDYKEALCFAMLAYATWTGRPGNLPAATGASRPALLGQVARP